MMRSDERFWTDRRGGTAVEYVLIAGLVALGAVAGVTGIGAEMLNAWTGTIVPELSAALTGA